MEVATPTTTTDGAGVFDQRRAVDSGWVGRRDELPRREGREDGPGTLPGIDHIASPRLNSASGGVIFTA